MIVNADDKKLLKSIINYRLKERSDKGAIVQLIIRPECNQKCDYCYLVQYGEESYPKYLRADSKTIIKNTEILMNYFTEEKIKIQKLDIFAGDLFYDNIFFEIIKPIYHYFKECNNLTKDSVIAMPCNMSFCEDKQKIKKVQQVIDDFKKINVRFFFSYSSDGIYSTDVREHKQISEEFFNTVLKFCEKNSGGVHPMIGYENIDNAIKNYEWWKKKYKEFDLGNTIPYYLEVRNNGWSKEKLLKYEEFLNYVLEDEAKYFNYDIDIISRKMLGCFDYDKVTNKYISFNSRNPFIEIRISDENDTNIHCGIGFFDICVNCADLRLTPCHRLAYPALSGGNFIVKDNKIVDLEPSENINGFIHLTDYNTTDKPRCVSCPINRVCIKGCVGAQYEYFRDPFFPIPNICTLLEIKYRTLFKFYDKIGVFDYIQEHYPGYQYLNILIEINNFFKNGGILNG